MLAPSQVSLKVRAGQIAWWVLPPAFCLALYWHGLTAWFRDDDFLWLQLRFRVHTGQDLWTVLFTPAAHGTFRPLSERAYFLLFGSLFPLDALPFRAWAFLTQFASLALVASITRRLTGSWPAGLLAALLWTANSNLAITLSWTSAYMQILCGFFLLLAFHFWLRHIETGRWRYYWCQWAVFLTGFLVLETNLVYPALAAAYALVRARRQLWRTLPLLGASLVYVALHMRWAPKQAAGPYALHFDGALASTLATYWRWIWEPYSLAALTGYPDWVAPAGTVLFSLLLLGYAAWSLRKRDWLPLMFLAWFVLLLAPVLPLRDHRSPYYLMLPSFALAMLGACAATAAWRTGRVWRAGAALGVGCYLLISAPGAWYAVRWHHQRSAEAEQLVFGVVRARQLHPRKAIMLTGVSNRQFWTAVWDGAFKVAGVSQVYLDHASQARIVPRLGADVADFFLPEEVAANALNRGEMVVYEAGGPRLKNLTRYYADRVTASAGRAPRRVNVGNPLSGYVLGPTWHPPADTHRWMPQRAALRLGGPRAAQERLYVTGYCPGWLLEPGPLEMTLSASGETLGAAVITQGDALFRFDYPLPARLVGQAEVEVEVLLSRIRIRGGEAYGLAFSVFEIR